MKHNLDELKGIYLTRETAIAVGTVTGIKELIKAAESCAEGEMIDVYTVINDSLQEKKAGVNETE